MEVVPNALRVLGGIHATFMFRQVIEEAPQVDVIVRGEGEEVLVNLLRAYEAGNFAETRHLRCPPAPFAGNDLEAIFPQ